MDNRTQFVESTIQILGLQPLQSFIVKNALTLEARILESWLGVSFTMTSLNSCFKYIQIVCTDQ